MEKEKLQPQHRDVIACNRNIVTSSLPILIRVWCNMYTSSLRHIHDPVLLSQDRNYTCFFMLWWNWCVNPFWSPQMPPESFLKSTDASWILSAAHRCLLNPFWSPQMPPESFLKSTDAFWILSEVHRCLLNPFWSPQMPSEPVLKSTDAFWILSHAKVIASFTHQSCLQTG